MDFDMKDFLNDVYEDVTDWLKFAEAKNAAVLTFNGVLIFGYFRVLSSNVFSFSLPFYLGILLSGVSILISLFSFFPRLRESQRLSHLYSIGKTNFRYYGDIYNLSPINYLRGIKRYYEGQDIRDFHKAEIDLSTQIITLSKITMIKAKFFTWSSGFTLANIALVIVLSMVYAF